MSLIAYEVALNLGRWALLHNGSPIATFNTKEEAEKAALAVAVHHPARDRAKIDLIGDDGPSSTIIID